MYFLGLLEGYFLVYIFSKEGKLLDLKKICGYAAIEESQTHSSIQQDLNGVVIMFH